jgi:hypothetical protein
MKNLIFALLFMFHNLLFSQLGVKLNTPEATNGYALFSNSAATYLVDNCGGIVNKWAVTQPENHCKLLPNGNLLYTKFNTIYELGWGGETIHKTVAQANDFTLDYEVIKLGNGNYLCVGRETRTLSEFEDHGYIIANTDPSVSDIVVEVELGTGKIVWRWNLFDHIIQDKRPSKKSFGDLKANPGKIDINAIATFDWEFYESFMINGMGYNPELDQIVLSVRKICEVVIIDHSTTTEEAKGSTGGKYKKGGDLLYRYGNPYNYRRGKVEDQQLFFQHNPQWILYGPHKGKISLFNNLLSSENYSSVEIIETPIKADGTYELGTDQPYQPLNPSVEFNEVTTNTEFSSGYTSGAKVLPNGNMIITEGQDSRIFEIDPSGKKVWEYYVKNGGYIFRSEKYDANYEAFIGKNLVPNGYVESPKSSYNCTIYKGTATENEASFDLKMWYSEDQIVTNLNEKFRFEIYDINGRLVHHGSTNTGAFTFTNKNSSGIYFIKITTSLKVYSQKIFI